MPLLGNLLQYRKNKIGFLSSLRDDGHQLTRFRLGKHSITLLKKPEDLVHVEHRNAKNYQKATMLRDLVGDGILMSEGEKWRKQRRLIQPRFHPSSVTALESLMNQRITGFLHRMESKVTGSEGSLEIGLHLKKLSFEIILQALFGEVDQGDFDELRKPMEFVNSFLTARFNELVPLPLWVPLPRYLRFQMAREAIDQVIHRYIDRKRKAILDQNPGTDLLTQMILSRDPDSGVEMDDLQIRDETVSILLAGFETTGNLLSWILVNLSREPAALMRVREEIDSSIGRRIPDANDVLGLAYFAKVVDETLRLQPSVWAWTKRAVGDDVLGNVKISEGQILFLSPYLVHRDPGIWDEPSRFNPDRWTEETKEKTKGAYFPFGMGPRTCVGKHFAVLEAKLILVRFLQHFEFRIGEEQLPEPDFQITLGFKRPLRAAVRARRSAS